MPQNTIYYINNPSILHKNEQNFYYSRNYILAQVLPLATVPSNLKNYYLKPDEVRILKPKYDLQSGLFLGIIESIGQVVVRGDENEIFMDYGFDEKKSKVLYSTYKLKIRSSFQTTMFKKHIQRFEKEDQNDFSRIYYYIPPTTDRIEAVNKLKGSVYLKTIDMEEAEFGECFDLSVLDQKDCCSKARELVVKVLQQMLHLGNSYLKQNADLLLLSNHDHDQNVLCPRQRIPEGKFALTY